MSESTESRLETLRGEERELVFARFDLGDAWRLGSKIAERTLAAAHAITIDIRRPNFILFRAAMPGATPDQDEWVRGKSATVLRLERSTAVLDAEFAAMGFDPSSAEWLPRSQYVTGGGSVPIRVAGVGVVAAVTVSGLTSDEDHDLVVACVREHLAEQAA